MVNHVNCPMLKKKKKKRIEKRSTEQRSDSTIKFNFLNWCKAIDLEVVNA